jgi:hypothetical protein
VFRSAGAIAEHPACAAAINSAGYSPFSFSNQTLNEYGVFASTPESDEMTSGRLRSAPLLTIGRGARLRRRAASLRSPDWLA